MRYHIYIYMYIFTDTQTHRYTAEKSTWKADRMNTVEKERKQRWERDADSSRLSVATGYTGWSTATVRGRRWELCLFWPVLLGVLSVCLSWPQTFLARYCSWSESKWRCCSRRAAFVGKFQDSMCRVSERLRGALLWLCLSLWMAVLFKKLLVVMDRRVWHAQTIYWSCDMCLHVVASDCWSTCVSTMVVSDCSRTIFLHCRTHRIIYIIKNDTTVCNDHCASQCVSTIATEACVERTVCWMHQDCET